MTLKAALGGMPVFIDPLVPLADSKGERILCQRLEGRLLVHPDRWDDFVDALARGAVPRLAGIH